MSAKARTLGARRRWRSGMWAWTAGAGLFVLAAVLAPGSRDPILLVVALVGATLAGYLAPRKRTVIWFAVVAASAGAAIFLGDDFSGARAAWLFASLALIVLVAAGVHYVRTLEERASNLEWRAELSAEAADLGLFRWDFDSDEVIANARLRALFALPQVGKISAADIFSKMHPDDVAVVEAAVEKARAEGVHYIASFRVQGPDGAIRWLAGRGKVFADMREGTRQLVGINFDITEQKRAEEEGLVLVRELNHRIKNLFSVTNALISLSARYASNVEEFAETTRSRLTALNAAHSAAAQDLRQRGAQLSTILGTILSLLRIDRAQVLIIGDDAEVSAGSATAWALIVHELCANAQRHGALRDPDGAVEIAWTSSDRRLSFAWRERRAEGAATGVFGEGFGTSIVRRLVESYLEGTVAFEMTPDGAAILIDAPLPTA